MKKIIYLLIFVISCTAHAAGITGLSEARHADDFALLDNRGNFHQLYYYSDMKAVILISQENGCPIVQKSYETLEQLRKKYESQNVVFLMINPQDDRAAITQEVKNYNVNIPVLEDRSQVVTEGLGVKQAAEALVIDPRDWNIVYHGTVNDLEDAIKAVLANKPVIVSQTSMEGCLFNFTKNNKQVTYTKDIAPILINKCIFCHSPGQIAPWSMDNYEQLKSHGAMIREVVRTKRMPQWGADPYYQEIKNDGSLTPDETRLLVNWVEQGMNKGQGADPLLTAPRPKTDEWPLGKPDLIVSLKNEQSIPAAGLLDLRTVYGDKAIDQDRWVRAIYWKRGNSRTLHHALLYAEAPASEHNSSFYESGSNASMMPGANSHAQLIGILSSAKTQGSVINPFPKDTGLFLPKGTQLVFSLHYTTTGKPEKDYTQVGFYFFQKKPKQIVSFLYYSNHDLKIPARVKNLNIKKFVLVDKNISLYGIAVHMHLRGRAMKCIAHYPDGSVETLLSVPIFRFDWQARYLFKKLIFIPAETNLELQATFDNSAQNTNNPDPDKEVKWGVHLQDEMMMAVFFYAKKI